MHAFEEVSSPLEVSGRRILAIIEGLQAFKRLAMKILEKNGIIDVKADGWYLQRDWLKSLREIYEKTGASTLFSVGRRVPRYLKWPDEVKSLEEALSSINELYHKEFRGNALRPLEEEVGSYKLLEMDSSRAILKADSPLPCSFDRGFLTGVVEKFRGSSMKGVRIECIEEENCRDKGGTECTYRISWFSSFQEAS